MLVQWQDSLAIGVPEVDGQHKEIFRRVNDLLTAMQEGRGRQEVSNLIEFLATYVVAHFAAEEKTMALNNYPEYVAHRQAHAAFIADFTELKRELEAHGSSSLLVIQVQRRVVDWLVHHIGKEDRKIGEYMKGK